MNWGFCLYTELEKSSFRLERDVFVEVIQAVYRSRNAFGMAGLLVSGRRSVFCMHGGGTAGSGFKAACTGRFRAFTVAQHLHGFRDDFRGITVLSVRTLPFAGAQTTFDVNRTALAEVFGGNFSLTAEKDDAVPFRFFLGLTVRVFVATRSSNRPKLPIMMTLFTEAIFFFFQNKRYQTMLISN